MLLEGATPQTASCSDQLRLWLEPQQSTHFFCLFIIGTLIQHLILLSLDGFLKVVNFRPAFCRRQPKFSRICEGQAKGISFWQRKCRSWPKLYLEDVLVFIRPTKSKVTRYLE